jgi:hypothetical protein
MNLSRLTALSTARFFYTELATRAREATGDADLVDGIYRAWMDKLETLSSFKTDPQLSDDTAQAVVGLVTGVAHVADDDHDALLRWLDVYPSAIAELFPPSESTFSVVGLENVPPLDAAVDDPAVEGRRFALVA